VDHKDGNWRNDLANRLMETAGLPVLRIWEASTKRHDWYTGKCLGGFCHKWGPCMHYCSPGPTMHWTCVLTLTNPKP
jgi:hypothetical protein